MVKKKSSKAETPDKLLAPAKKNQNYDATTKARGLIEKANKLAMTKSGFINRCVEEYGPVLLGKLEPGEDVPSLATRLKYLETVAFDLAYDRLLEKLKKEDSIAEHQALLKKVKPSSWAKTKSILSRAVDDPATKNTKKSEWQTLIRKREEFLAEGAEED